MPRLHRERQAVEQAKVAVADRRAKLALKPPDKADAAAQILRLWKLDKFNALPDSERNAAVADPNDKRGGARFLPATPEQIEAGIFFRDGAEYNAARGEA